MSFFFWSYSSSSKRSSALRLSHHSNLLVFDDCLIQVQWVSFYLFLFLCHVECSPFWQLISHTLDWSSISRFFFFLLMWTKILVLLLVWRVWKLRRSWSAVSPDACVGDCLRIVPFSPFDTAISFACTSAVSRMAFLSSVPLSCWHVDSARCAGRADQNASDPTAWGQALKGKSEVCKVPCLNTRFHFKTYGINALIH